jgi:hypothetical protein
MIIIDGFRDVEGPRKGMKKLLKIDVTSQQSLVTTYGFKDKRQI